MPFAIKSEEQLNLPKNKIAGKKVLLSTLPRSGTWYHLLFFHALDSLLTGKQLNFYESGVALDMSPDCKGIGLHFHLAHAYCLGFTDHKELAGRKWESIKLPDFEKMMNYDCYPVERDSRAVYIFRHPLDQAVSLQRHYKNSQIKDRVVYAEGKSPSEFLREYSFPLFVKQYLTFSVMQNLYPDNVLITHYEDCKDNPLGHFTQLLEFYGSTVTESSPEAVEKAVNMCQLSYFQRLEKDIGRPLGGESTHTTGSHVHGGEIGEWKEVFSEEDINWCKEYLADYDLTFDSIGLEV